MLEIRNLSKRYPNGVQALKGINLTVATGMFGLLGPNGAGKSTLMRTLATLQLPDSGQVRFNGNQVLRQPQLLRPVLGYLPQDFGVYPGMSAFSLLEHFALLKGLSDKKARRRQIDALLELTNLSRVRNKAVSGFSGGMKQRFGIAQALLGAPKLLIVDEPTAGLDPEERNRFHNLLSDLSENTVVILSTHIVEDINNLCPDMAILAQGEIIARGAPDKLTAMLNGRLWRSQVEKKQLNACLARHQVVSHRLVAGRVEVRALADACPAAGFEPVQPDLEDAYFSLLNGHVGSASGPGKNLLPETVIPAEAS
ncbi:ABC transporter ATP-binding protein [Thalassomonas viridans]|uniref:ABC transporter ATP-binding protein n=1 Tax=Thalassomonas viridans TaxID=137584 RepID=A0AAF0CAN8_9GAMM|nr:ABC transporter ATP-binding protein [Thalassomonas viridans]WDE08757.1 ABC transporter ATP-binding protein [Thalassomonas viridans]